MPQIIRNLRGFNAITEDKVLKKELEKSEVEFTKEDREFLDLLKKEHFKTNKIPKKVKDKS